MPIWNVMAKSRSCFLTAQQLALTLTHHLPLRLVPGYLADEAVMIGNHRDAWVSRSALLSHALASRSMTVVCPSRSSARLTLHPARPSCTRLSAARALSSPKVGSRSGPCSSPLGTEKNTAWLARPSGSRTLRRRSLNASSPTSTSTLLAPEQGTAPTPRPHSPGS